uniref:histidine--tRNA ligase n=1 Tax=uncultured Sphingopyxis sp. TaxID=310581 RepID=UPI002598725F
TAGIARAYITNGWQQFAPLKVATHGPLFRYERPQKGRYRQFHQLDAEVLGSDSPLADAELLVFADQLLKELGISEGVTLTLNTLGDAESRNRWRAALIEHFQAHGSYLSEESQVRLNSNPLRILDSKDREDQKIVEMAPGIDAYLTSEARDFFDAVKAGLEAAGVESERNSRLVRGLDYYRHTAFEFVTDRLGAQGTVLGGGRYDGLIENLGGPPTPAVGWAAGIERLAMLLSDDPKTSRPDIVVVVESDDLDELAFGLVAAFRRERLAAEIVASGSLRKRFDKAMKLGSPYIFSLNSNLLDDGQLAAGRLKQVFVPKNQTSRILKAFEDVLYRRFDLNGSDYHSGMEVTLFPKVP